MVARRAHNPKVEGSSPFPATTLNSPDVYDIYASGSFFNGAPGERTFYQVKVPNPHGIGIVRNVQNMGFSNMICSSAARKNQYCS